MSARPRSIAFVIEDAVGHVTHGQGIREALQGDPRIDARWLPMPHRGDTWIARLPGVPFSISISLRARHEVLRCLRGPVPPQALFFHTQVLTPASYGLIGRVPSVISLDATPSDYAAYAKHYGSAPPGATAAAAKTHLMRWLFGRARSLVAMSHWVGRGLQRDYGVPAHKIKVLPPGIDLTAWALPGRAQAAGQPLRLLFVGADFERKGGAQLLQAWRSGQWRNVELDIVTRDPTVQPAPGLRVHRGLTPNAPALRQLFAQADAFVLPTLADFSPFAVIEAMASGLPVVATRVGAIDEMVEHGRSGLLLPAGDVAALTQAVAALQADRDATVAMGRAARDAATRRYDARANYRRLLDHLHDVTAPEPPPA